MTEGLFAAFTEFAMTTNPLSKNARYARAHGFEGLVCPPGLVMLVAFSQTVEDVSENARANLEYVDMRFGAPVYVGDTIEVETKVLGVRTSASRPNLGIVHVQSTARKNIGERDEAIVAHLAAQGAGLQGRREGRGARRRDRARRDRLLALAAALRAGRATTSALAHLSNPDTYFEDFEPGTRIEHSRGRTMTSEHIALTAMLDNTSQVHCNQYMIDQDPAQYVGGQLIIFGGIPFVLCLGLSCPDVARQRARRPRLQDRAATPRRSSRATRCSRPPRSSASASSPAARTSASSRRACFGHKFVRERSSGRLREEGRRSSSSTATSS